MSWINVAIAAGSALYGGYQSKRQGDAAIKAGKDPLKKDRRGYADDLQGLIDDPASFYSNPLYQSAFGQGTQAVVRGMAAQGYAGSGNMATGLQQFGMSFGYDMLQEYEKLLAELAGFSHFPDQGAASSLIMDSRQGMQDAFGQLGGIWGRYGGDITKAVGGMFGGGSGSGIGGTGTFNSMGTGGA